MLNEKELENIGKFIEKDCECVWNTFVEYPQLVLQINSKEDGFQYIEQPLEQYSNKDSEFLIKDIPFILDYGINDGCIITTLKLREYDVDNEEELFLKELKEDLDWDMTISRLKSVLTERLGESEFSFNKDNVDDKCISWNGYIIDYVIKSEEDDISNYEVRVTNIYEE